MQGEVESALRRLSWTGAAIASAGRTDTGAHASGQVIACELDWSHPEDELGRALNAILPADVAIRSVKLAAPGFHPRYSATARTYHYHLYCGVDRDPLRERYAWRVWPEVKLDLLQGAADLLVGQHDFAPFGRPPHAGGSTGRMVYRACWQPEDGGLRFEVSANAFLYHMVRRMVFLLALVGQGQLPFADLAALVQGEQVAQAAPPGIAPAHGLVLVEVQYAGRRATRDS